MSTGFQARPAVLGVPAGSSATTHPQPNHYEAYQWSLPASERPLQACQNSHIAVANLGYMNPPAPINYTQTQPHHGIKRSAPDDEVESTSNITGELKKLRLHTIRPSRIVPVHHHTESKNPNSSIQQDERGTRGGIVLANHHEVSNPVSLLANQYKNSANDRYLASKTASSYIAPKADQVCDRNSDTGASNVDEDNDFMPVDETPNRVYIPDLEREIAEIEADEDRHNHTISHSFFLPDVDKNISKIPLNVLRQSFDTAVAAESSRAAAATAAANAQALVLYRDPSSISVPEEEDVVRKAIIASRKEARAKMKLDYEREHEGLDPTNIGSKMDTSTNGHNEVHGSTNQGTGPETSNHHHHHHHHRHHNQGTDRDEMDDDAMDLC